MHIWVLVKSQYSFLTLYHEKCIKNTIQTVFFDPSAYPTPKGINFHTSLNCKQTCEGCIHVVKDLSQRIGLPVVLKMQNCMIHKCCKRNRINFVLHELLAKKEKRKKDNFCWRDCIASAEKWFRLRSISPKLLPGPQRHKVS